MEQVVRFHDHTMVVLVAVVGVVRAVIVSTGANTYINRSLLENQGLETV